MRDMLDGEQPYPLTRESGLGGRAAFSTSALWFDFDRDGLLDLFVCNYVRWSVDHDVFCSNDGKQKSYCTPEAYRGDTCWLFKNRGDGIFEDVSATSGIFDSSSKSLGAAILDVDGNGWLDLLVANDTQPNKLYRNQKDGTFKEAAGRSRRRLQHRRKGARRHGHRRGLPGRFADTRRAITNFDNEMIGLYRASSLGLYDDIATRAGIGAASRSTLGFGCLFADFDLDGSLDLIVANGHIDETVRNIHGHVGYAQPPHLFLNDGKDAFNDVAPAAGEGFAAPKVGRGVAYGDFDRDGDLDILMTTNGGPAKLFPDDQVAGNRSVRFRLTGTKSNRDAIGATVRIFHGGTFQTRMVKTGSSYLSQSELPVTFGVGRRDRLERVVIAWPSGRVEEFNNIRQHGRTIVSKTAAWRHRSEGRLHGADQTTHNSDSDVPDGDQRAGLPELPGEPSVAARRAESSGRLAGALAGRRAEDLLHAARLSPGARRERTADPGSDRHGLGSQGRLWVVEMPGFVRDLQAPEPNLEPIGKVVVLEDTNHDGRWTSGRSSRTVSSWLAR